jgi:hypothetical protein
MNQKEMDWTMLGSLFVICIGMLVLSRIQDPPSQSKNTVLPDTSLVAGTDSDGTDYDAGKYDDGYGTDYGVGYGADGTYDWDYNYGSYSYYSAPEKVKIFHLDPSESRFTEKKINDWLSDGKIINGFEAVNVSSGSVRIIYRYRDVVEPSPAPSPAPAEKTEEKK